MPEGWDPRPVEVAAALAASTAVGEGVVAVGHPPRPLASAGYTNEVALPDHFVTSVRVIVRVGDCVVVCTNADGVNHPWPGGRREPGESLAETACREVHEETGWLLNPSSLVRLGWLHFEALFARPDGVPHRYADFFHLVFVGRATDREGGPDVEWVDSAGYELSSRLLTIPDAKANLNGTDGAIARIFLDLVAAKV